MTVFKKGDPVGITLPVILGSTTCVNDKWIVNGKLIPTYGIVVEDRGDTVLVRYKRNRNTILDTFEKIYLEKAKSKKFCSQ